MGVYIPKMEMPTCCGECPLICEFDLCKRTRGKEKSDACPLVEVPPHGDLIDRDALTEELLRHLDALDGLDRSEMAQRDGLSCAIGDVDEAPTIIESEGEEK